MLVEILLSLAALLATAYLYLSRKSSRSNLPLPPGPKPLPVIGNIRDLTTRELWLKAEEWKREYGDITYLHVGGQGLVFLASPETTSDLLDKRGGWYSDKPHLTMACDLCGCDNMVAFTPYGPRSRRQRRLMNSAFGIPAIPSYHPLITSSTHTFLGSLLTSPNKWIDHTKLYAGSLTLSVVYGYKPAGADDKILNLAEECVSLLSNRIASTGAIWLVDIFPSLKRFPKWLPQPSFLANAKIWKKKMEEFVDVPFQFLVQSLKSGHFETSFCSKLLEAEDPEKQTDQFLFDLKWTANSMYAASLDTTVTAMSHFLLAMMTHPEVLKQAQEEVDRVVGPDRLPTFQDRHNLPFVEAVLSETLRWGCPVPLNLPHRLTKDDIYRGMYIPKGSLVFGNIWSITRDTTIYPDDPHAFKPERFLEPIADEIERKRRDPRSYVFGFGRRRCPGANLVEASIWILLASVIATLDISKPKNEIGEEEEVEVKFENAVFRTPTPFKCDLRPRSQKAVQLIRQSEGL